LHVLPGPGVQQDQETEDPATAGDALKVSDVPMLRGSWQTPMLCPSIPMSQLRLLPSVIVPVEVPADPATMSVIVGTFGVTLLDGADAGPVPTPLVAFTVNV
jgi:hypothetical protein